ncbi:hypothetical protein GWI33_003467 [Rhynchophorus ferrugineus]|uniref:Uncharacterized protein n=1 Tax=Rhynchophorus ferrugineus TaxID=354439 RepID=A0A834IJG1_RHYFE|nr:hypothetical protein GWI33_003467 [Rhynchophorus ferrugineus]
MWPIIRTTIVSKNSELSSSTMANCQPFRLSRTRYPGNKAQPSSAHVSPFYINNYDPMRPNIIHQRELHPSYTYCATYAPPPIPPRPPIVRTFN